MKFKLTSVLSAIILFFAAANAQDTLISQDFTGYDGSAASVPEGWYFSYNVAGTSLYNSATSSGVNPPSYKFGVDSSIIITPAFSLADSVSFFVKGSTTFNDTNRLDIYESADSVIWTLLVSIDSLPISKTTFAFPVLPTSTHLKFIYTKIAGNLAFDDLVVWSSNLGTGIKENHSNNNFVIFPNPSTGIFNLDLGRESRLVEVVNIIGKTMLRKELQGPSSLDLSKFAPGNYFIKITSNAGVQTKKISVLR